MIQYGSYPIKIQFSVQNKKPTSKQTTSMNRLPTEVLRLIYQFDSTYRNYFQKDVLCELNEDCFFSRERWYDKSCSIRNYCLGDLHHPTRIITPRFFDPYTGKVEGVYYILTTKYLKTSKSPLYKNKKSKNTFQQLR